MADGHFDWVIHATGHDRFDRATFEPTAKDMRGFGCQRFAIDQFVFLFSKSAFAPIDPAIASPYTVRVDRWHNRLMCQD